MGNENSMMPSPKQSPKAEGQEQISSSSAFPYVRGSREARLRSHKVSCTRYILLSIMEIKLTSKNFEF